MQQLLTTLTCKQAQEYMKKGQTVFAQAPHLPENFREFLATIAPWLTIVGALFAGLATVSNVAAVFGGSAMMRMYAYYATAPMMYFLVMAVFQALSAVLLFNAFKPLQDRLFTGWAYLFWNMVLGVASGLVPVIFGYGVSLIGFVLGLVIGFYILYEIRPLYAAKKKAAVTDKETI